MECEPFLPLSRVTGVPTLSKGTRPAAAAQGVHTETASRTSTRLDTEQPWATSFSHSRLSAPNLKVPTITTPVTGTIIPFIPHQDKPMCRQFCLDTEAVLTLALVKPQCTKSTMPNIYNLYKNSTSPYWPPQDENR